jgi:prevent-host-death family protein
MDAKALTSYIPDGILVLQNVQNNVHFIEKQMLEAISITDARRDFLPLLSRIESEPYRFMVTKHGKPVAVVLNYAEYSRMMETLRLMENSRWSQRLDAGINQADTGVLVEASTLRSRHA